MPWEGSAEHVIVVKPLAIGFASCFPCVQASRVLPLSSGLSDSIAAYVSDPARHTFRQRRVLISVEPLAPLQPVAATSTLAFSYSYLFAVVVLHASSCNLRVSALPSQGIRYPA